VSRLRVNLLGDGGARPFLAVQAEGKLRAGLHRGDVKPLAGAEWNGIGGKAPARLDPRKKATTIDRDSQGIIHGTGPGAENLSDPPFGQGSHGHPDDHRPVALGKVRNGIADTPFLAIEGERGPRFARRPGGWLHARGALEGAKRGLRVSSKR